MGGNPGRQWVQGLRSRLQHREGELREEIRQTLLRSDSEQYAQIADQVHDLEDESFAGRAAGGHQEWQRQPCCP